MNGSTVFYANTRNGLDFELNARERKELRIEFMHPEATIYRRCIDAGHSVDSVTERAARDNSSREDAARAISHRSDRRPLVFLEG
jgi:hypothetical protein